MDIIKDLHKKIVVSSQAMPNEPFYDENCMIAMMKSVVNGGAGALRVAGARDVKNAKSLFKIPVIGLTKPQELPPNWRSVVYITPTLKEVKELVRAGVLPSDYDFEAHKKLVPMQPGDVPVTYADTSALERDFGFKPSTSLRTGLRKFAEWYKEFYEA